MNVRSMIAALTVLLFALPETYGQDGTLDPTFHNDGVAYHYNVNKSTLHPNSANKMLVMPDSCIVLGCQTTRNPSVIPALANHGFVFCRLNKEGKVIDTVQLGIAPYYYKGFRYTEPPNNISADWNGVRDLDLLPSGKILVTGSILNTSGYPISAIFRLNYPAMTLDSSYGTNGMGQVWDGALQVSEKTAVAADGSTYTVGNYLQLVFGDSLFAYIVKRKPNGSLDSSWQTNGVYRYKMQLGPAIYDIKLAADGSIYSCGTYRDAAKMMHGFILKQRPNGTTETSFGVNGVSEISYGSNNIIVNTDGSTYLNVTPYTDPVFVMKFKPNGKPDSTFGVNGRCTFPLTSSYHGFNDMIVQPNGRIVMAGTGQATSAAGFDSAWVTVWRIKTNGRSDSTFGVNGIADLHIMPDTVISGAPKINRGSMCAAFQKDGKLLIGGYFMMSNITASEMMVLRLKNALTTPVTGISTIGKERLDIAVAPNPAREVLYLQYKLTESDNLHARLTDINGRIVMDKYLGAQSPGSYNTTISLPSLSAGIYMLQVTGKTAADPVRILVK